jgi:hypothetical protein
VWLTGLPVPVALPSPKFQLNEYGDVPPLVVAVNVTGLPAVIDVGLQVKSVARVDGLIVIVADAVAVAAFASVATTEMVLLPLVE